MLEFKEVFKQHQAMSRRDIPTIMRCHNIDFSHVNWFAGLFGAILNSNTEFMKHLVNNVVDINVYDNNNSLHNTFSSGIIRYSNNFTLRYMLNNRFLTNNDLSNTQKWIHCRDDCYVSQSIKIISYLTRISLSKFTGFCNTEKYYYMIHTILLIMKVQKMVPILIIKHLIIPFIYQ